MVFGECQYGVELLILRLGKDGQRVNTSDSGAMPSDDRIDMRKIALNELQHRPNSFEFPTFQVKHGETCLGYIRFNGSRNRLCYKSRSWSFMIPAQQENSFSRGVYFKTDALQMLIQNLRGEARQLDR